MNRLLNRWSLACVVSALVMASSAPAALAQVCAPTKVGYYDTGWGYGIDSQVAPITKAGLSPVFLSGLTSSDLRSINVLFLSQSNFWSYSGQFLEQLPAIEAAVKSGMVLVIHDRHVDGASAILPGGGDIKTVGNVFLDWGAGGPANQNIDILDDGTTVTNGPGGVVTESNLDGFLWSNHGYAESASLPEGARPILSNGNPEQIVTFGYPYGAGYVIYSTIPLDFYLFTRPDVSIAALYGPNIVAYAGTLRPAQSSFALQPATATYGGTTSLTGTISNRGFSLPIEGIEVSFSLFGALAGTATTDAGGNATLENIQVPQANVGDHPDSATASFASPRFCGSGSSTVTITQAPVSIHVTGGTFTYDGTPHPAETSVTGAFNENLGAATVSYTNQATGVTDTAPPVTPGVYRVNASFPGGGNYLPGGHNAVSITILKSDTTTVLSSSPNPSTFGQSVLIQVVVSPVAPGGGSMTGQVIVKDNGTQIGSFPVGDSMTTTQLSVTLPGAGHQLTAEYAGDPNFNGSTSTLVAHEVKAAMTYVICLLYDPGKLHNSGSTIPIRIQVCDSARANLSSPSLIVHAVGVRLVSTTTAGTLASAGNANPDLDFRLVGWPRSYLFNLKTTGLTKGTYELVFTVGLESTLYAAPFQIR